MTKIAVIGSSHVAALKLGWDQIATEYPGADFTFFAAPGKAARTHNLREMIYGNHNPKTEEDERIFGYDGGPTIDLSEMDIVIKSGQRSGLQYMGDILRAHAIGIGPAADRPFLLSQHALTAICRGIAERHAMAGPWLGWEDTRLFICPNPVPDENVMESSLPRLESWRAAGLHGEDFKYLRRFYNGIYAEVLAGQNIGLLDQPEETIAKSGLTRLEYSNGAHLMFRDDDERDVLHMNTDYGALQLRQFLELVGVEPVAGAPTSRRKSA